MLTVAGTISQSSYQNPAFESRRAVQRRQTTITAIAHVAIILPFIGALSLDSRPEDNVDSNIYTQCSRSWPITSNSEKARHSRQTTKKVGGRTVCPAIIKLLGYACAAELCKCGWAMYNILRMSSVCICTVCSPFQANCTIGAILVNWSEWSITSWESVPNSDDTTVHVRFVSFPSYTYGSNFLLVSAFVWLSKDQVTYDSSAGELFTDRQQASLFHWTYTIPQPVVH